MGGRNKLYLEVEGSLLIERILRRTSLLFRETLLLVASGETDRVCVRFAPLIEKYNVSLVEDRSPNRGPLEGLRMGLSEMKYEWGFLLGCDMPTPCEETIRGLFERCCDDTDAIVAELNGYLEPLHAFYKKSCTVSVENAIARGDRKMKRFYNDVRLTIVKEETLSGDYESSFFNINTQHDIEILSKRGNASAI